MAQESNPFIRQLTSSNRTTRDRALSALRTYLHRATLFSELDFLKLWKGLYYCMWMQDKPRNQQRLARDSADLVDVLQGKENVLGFLEAFWKTMGREWGSIDALRMDKYLYLVRCYVNKGFEVCAKKQWADEEILEGYMSILEKVPLSPRGGKIPNGLRHHVVDVYVDELEKADEVGQVPLEEVLRPLKRLGKETVTKSVRERVKEALEDERLAEWDGKRTGDGDDDGGKGLVRNHDKSGGDVDGVDRDNDDFGGFED